VSNLQIKDRTEIAQNTSNQFINNLSEVFLELVQNIRHLLSIFRIQVKKSNHRVGWKAFQANINWQRRRTKLLNGTCSTNMCVPTRTDFPPFRILKKMSGRISATGCLLYDPRSIR
jgi:hypothetical protein